MYKAAQAYPRLWQAKEITFELNAQTLAISELSETYRLPVELDLVRVVLARSAGLGVLESSFAEFLPEGYEWEEAVAFGNEHLRRIAQLIDDGKEAPVIKLVK